MFRLHNKYLICISNFQSEMDEIQKNLESNRQVFLNQASYESAVMLSIKNSPASNLTLKRLCELNSKRFLPFWSLVMEKVTSPVGHFELFMSMVYGIRPFLDNRSSYKTPSCAFETLSQSVERHLQRIIGWTRDFYKSELQALKLARIILKHTGRSIEVDTTVLCKELIVLLKKKRDSVEWEEEISKFICLLLPSVNGLNDIEFTFLEQLYSEYIMKALVKKFPARYHSSITIFNDEIVFEYIIGALDAETAVGSILFERVLKSDNLVKKLIPKAKKMNHQILMLLVNCSSCLAELCKYAPSEIHPVLLEKCLSTKDLEALANLLNLTLNINSLGGNNQKVIFEFLNGSTGFETLRCWLGLAKNGMALPSPVIENIRTNFVITSDPKTMIIMCMILKLTEKNIPTEHLKSKLEEFGDNSRVQKHLLTLLEG